MELTSNEKKVIRKISIIQIESLLRLGKGGHPTFDRFCEVETPDDRFEGMAEIGAELLLKVDEFSKIEKNPEKLFELDAINLMIVQLITGRFISNERYPRTKKKLLRKLEIAHSNTQESSLN